MPDDNNFKLLEVVLAEVRNVREEVSEVRSDLGVVRSDQVRKHDFQLFTDKLESRFKSIEDNQTKQALEVNTHAGFIESTRWAFRIFGVAILGCLVTGATSFFHVSVGSAATSTPPAHVIQIEQTPKPSLRTNTFSLPDTGLVP